MATAHLFRNAPGVVPVAAGEYIFRKGDSAKVMYMIIEGEVNLLLGTTVIETAGEGSFIGEMALIDDAARSASARARTDCRIFPINEIRFQSLVRKTPFFALQVMKTLADRLRRTNALISAKSRARKKAASRKKT